jgi:c-di-GMP-binding flagellar brake protein YcgR
MGYTNPFPEPEAPELERFVVYARAEIISMLRQLGEQAVLATVYYDRHAGFAVTTLLAVHPDVDEVIFDVPGDDLALGRLLAAGELVFVAFLERIKVQFRAGMAQATLHDGKPALRVGLPPEVLRLQRRDFFRVTSPSGKPAMCLVPYVEGADGAEGVGHDEGASERGATTYEKLALFDIGIGGLAVMDYPDKFALAQGMTIEGCYLDLPGIGQVIVSLKVRHLDQVPRSERARRVGCEFVNLAPQARMMLQRYVNMLEAEQRKVAGRPAVTL